MNTNLITLISGLDTHLLPDERKLILEPLRLMVRDKAAKQEEIRLNFICTHNSRRSHLSQIWAQTMAFYYNYKSVHCFSAGTEATAVFPEVLNVLGHHGFLIKKLAATHNPLYMVKFAPNAQPVIAFSKMLNHPFNPQSEFAAILTCDSANESCPIIKGADIRFPITYKDPKAFDGTEEQFAKYLERSLQIATEMKYIFQPK